MKKLKPGKFHLTITGQFILYLTGMSVIPLLVVGIIAYAVSFSTIQKQTDNYTTELVSNQRDYLDVLLQEVESLIINISGVEDITNILDSQNDSADNTYTNLATQAKIGYILNNYINLKGLVSIDIYTQGGDHYHVGDTLQTGNTIDLVDNNLYKKTSNLTGTIFWTGIEENINTNSTYRQVITAVKIFNKIDTQTNKVNPIALLVVNYNPGYLYEHFSKLQMGEGAYLMIIDKENRIIFHPNENLIGSKVNREFTDKLNNNKGTINTHIDGKDMMVTYNHSENSDWIVASFIPISTLTAQTFPILTSTILVLLASFASVFFLGWLYSRNLVNPIRQISHTFERYEQGKLEQGARLEHKGQDEVGELVHWFNEFLENQEEKNRAEEELRSRQHFLSLLNKISQTSLGSENIEKMLHLMAGHLADYFQSDNCYFLLANNGEEPGLPYFIDRRGTIVEQGIPEIISYSKLLKKPAVVKDARRTSLFPASFA